MDFVTFVTTYGIGIISALAFVVNVIVEMTKDMGFLKKLPTNVYVVVLSVILTVVAYAVAGSILSIPFEWYAFILAAFAGFIVAYIAMFGWDKLQEVREKYKK